MLAFLIAIILRTADPAEVRVSTLEGSSRSGQLQSLSLSDLVIDDGAETATIPLADVMAISFDLHPVVRSEAPQSIMLTDGTKVYGSSLSLTAKQLSIDSASLGKVSVHGDSVMAVRLQGENAGNREQWNTFLQRKSDKDLLIVVKRDGSGLDYLAGVVSSISGDKIGFLLDGDSVEVPSARVYGVVFRRTERDRVQKPQVDSGSIRVLTTSGDSLSATSVKLNGEMLQLETPWKQSLVLRVSEVRSVDFSSGRVRYLSDMEPIDERFEGVDTEGNLLAWLLDARQQALLFGPRRDSSLEPDSKIRLRGREFEKGLCIHSRTQMSWALDKNYAVFDCQVGIDDEVSRNGHFAVSLSILGDGVVLFEKTIETSDEPVPLRLSVDGVSTLSVLVDFGDGDSTCDWLNLAEARLFVSKDPR